MSCGCGGGCGCECVTTRVWPRLVRARSTFGSLLVRFWSVKSALSWFNPPRLVRFWSAFGLLLVRFWSTFGPRRFSQNHASQAARFAGSDQASTSASRRDTFDCDQPHVAASWRRVGNRPRGRMAWSCRYRRSATARPRGQTNAPASSRRARRQSSGSTAKNDIGCPWCCAAASGRLAAG